MAPDTSFPDYPEREPYVHHMEQTLRKAADFFRVIGSDTMAKECEKALQPADHQLNGMDDG
jgi:hypothetical protein